MSEVAEWFLVGLVLLGVAWCVWAEIRDIRQVDREVAARKAARDSGTGKKRGEQ
ncbi:MAG TPA: hypothetical protein VGK43_06325 [Solirubrobacterales bacterium]